MKKLLLLTFVAASAAMCTPSAQAKVQEALNGAQRKSLVAQPMRKTPVASAQVLNSTKLADDVRLDVVKTKSGYTMKRLVSPRFESKMHQPARVLRAESAGLNESFEDWDYEDYNWQPEGWSTLSKAEVQSPWAVTESDGYYVPQCDGYVLEFIEYNEDYLDEYLVTPKVSIEQDNVLSFYMYVDPVYFFSMDNLDFDTYEYDGDKVVVQTVKILASEDGETWTELLDLSTEYLDSNFMELYYASSSYTGTFRKYNLDLSAYVGKSLQFAFEYVGADGNSVMLDNVCVGAPSMEVSYVNPSEMLYMGLSSDLYYFSYSTGIEPVYAPITWTNTSEELPGAEFVWAYHNPDEASFAYASTKDLTVTYHTDYTSDFTTMNNFYYTPTLYGQATGTTQGDFSKLTFVQCGGKGQFDDGEDGAPDITQYGMASFDYATEGITISTEDAGGTPIFGYSGNTDSYWTNYSFPDSDDQGEGNYAYLDGIINVYAPAKAPLVLDGAWLIAYASNIKSDAEFKLEIIPLTDEGTLDNPIATATIKGSDVVKVYSNYHTLNFKFDEPVVISSDLFAQYAVRITGIHECADYFAPIQSASSNTDGMYIGWIQKVVSWMNDPQISLSAVVRYTGLAQSFAIMLDGTYPWLEGADEVDMGNSATGKLSLDSYYDGSEFTVSAPSWVDVTVSGQYDKCEATFTVNHTEVNASDNEVTLEVPGIKKTVKLVNVSGVKSIVNDNNAQVVEYISLTGARLGANKPENAGVYVARYSDGKFAKVIVK